MNKINRQYISMLLRAASDGTLITRQSPQQVAGYLMNMVIDLESAKDGWCEEELEERNKNQATN